MFKSRKEMDKHPIIDMVSYGTWNQPKGTWSDDTSMTLCLIDNMIIFHNNYETGCNIDDAIIDLSIKFQKWYFENEYTPYGLCFDTGKTTTNAIHMMRRGNPKNSWGGTMNNENGNGSLMRILPLVFLNKNEDFEDLINNISSMTHAHDISKISCVFYVKYARLLYEGYDKFEAYQKMMSCDLFKNKIVDVSTRDVFNRILNGNIQTIAKDKIFSSGYVIHTLEASIWCILTSKSYEESVLKAINLGHDTDTTACVTGGLAGLIWKVPKKWIHQLARKDYIESKINDFSKIFLNKH